MGVVKTFFKQNTHNLLFGGFANLGKAIIKLYENQNHNIASNGEAWLIKQISRLKPRVIFDVGANTGKYCKEILKHSGTCDIYCFEPVKKTFELLQGQVRSAQVHFFQQGLYCENKKLSIYIYPSHTHASVFQLKAVPYEQTGIEEIEVVRGDDFVRQHKISFIDLLKLDIEGSELDALKGFELTIRERNIRAIQFEYGYINITTRNLLIDYYEFFESFGYIIGKLYPRSVSFRKYKFKDEDFRGPNFVAVHKDDQELLRLLK
jgi:FkbM family methyltransferase